MRDFVRGHDAYAGDGVVSDKIAHDLIRRCHDVGVGKVRDGATQRDFNAGVITYDSRETRHGTRSLRPEKEVIARPKMKNDRAPSPAKLDAPRPA